jgi:methyl-accepting chemotaxis protein
MPANTGRKPIANFFIKKDLQLRLITKIVLAVLAATMVSALTLLGVYYLRYESVLLYQMDHLANLTKENIIAILLPTLLISGLVNIVVAFFIGLYASRKYAVPIYKLEQWSSLLNDGNLTAQLRFREKDEMRELTRRCNELSESLRQKFVTLKAGLKTLDEAHPQSEAIKELREIVDSMAVDTGTIEVHTTFVHRP